MGKNDHGVDIDDNDDDHEKENCRAFRKGSLYIKAQACE